jgi:hypothetical protein
VTHKKELEAHRKRREANSIAEGEKRVQKDAK